MNAVQRSRCLSWGPIGVYRLGFGTGTSLHCESSIWSLCLFWFLGFCDHDPNNFFGFIFVHVVTQPRACMLWLIPITCDGGCHGTLGGWLSALGLWGKPHRMIGAEGKSLRSRFSHHQSQQSLSPKVSENKYLFHQIFFIPIRLPPIPSQCNQWTR